MIFLKQLSVVLIEIGQGDNASTGILFEISSGSPVEVHSGPVVVQQRPPGWRQQVQTAAHINIAFSRIEECLTY